MFNCNLLLRFRPSDWQRYFGVHVAHGCFLNSIWHGTPRGRRPWIRSREYAIKITNLSRIFECINRAWMHLKCRDPPHFMHAWASAWLTCPYWRWPPSQICAPSATDRPSKTLIRPIPCLGHIAIAIAVGTLMPDPQKDLRETQNASNILVIFCVIDKFIFRGT